VPALKLGQKSKLGEINLGKCGFYLLLMVIILPIVFPFYWMIVQSVQKDSVFTFAPHIFPGSVTFNSYRTIIKERPVVTWFANTFFIAALTTVITVFVATLSGYSLSRFRNRFSKAAGFAILTTQMLPATLLLIPMYIIFRDLNLLDNLFGLVLSNTAFALPMGLWMMKSFIDGIPIEIDEAGRIDGCNPLQILFRLIIPLVLPGIVAVATFAFLLAWDDFFFARTFISTESKWLMSVGLNSFIGEYSIQWDQMLSAAVMFSLPPIIFFLFLQKYLIKGLTLGSVKN
jgi:multiple sugar transport system permease protein